MAAINKILVPVLVISSLALGQEVPAPPAQARVDKTVIVNFLKSLVIPGWGQWSTGHKVKAGAFLAAELGAIAGYQINFSAGDDEARKFKSYANEHWYYGTWLAANPGGVEETACDNLRTHQMPTLTDIHGNEILDSNNFPVPLKDHHYYENISKYPEFICGWDDMDAYYEEDGKDYTPNKLKYIDMRTHSNEMYRRAEVAGTLLMVNHLISALDAAIGTDITSFETTNYSGKFYINPLSATSSIQLEVRF